MADESGDQELLAGEAGPRSRRAFFSDTAAVVLAALALAGAGCGSSDKTEEVEKTKTAKPKDEGPQKPQKFIEGEEEEEEEPNGVPRGKKRG